MRAAVYADTFNDEFVISTFKSRSNTVFIFLSSLMNQNFQNNPFKQVIITQAVEHDKYYHTNYDNLCIVQGVH